MSSTGRKITKRACDGCKIRKVKCSGLSPCDGCLAVRISCTYLKHPGIRGPRKLRKRTLQEIAQTQQLQTKGTQHAIRQRDPPHSNSATILPLESPPLPVAIQRNEPCTRIPIASLVLHLCVYRLRMFPVWPVVRVEDIMARLQRDEEDTENYALATAVGAATVAQLKLTKASLGGDAVSADIMEAECQRARSAGNVEPPVNLTTLRTAFFLHVYHENQEAGGLKSMLYLREAITIAQMMRLHKESSYLMLSSEEQQIRRRILWLLFVTERGVAMLHKLPVVLKANIAFPLLDRDDDAYVLPAFQRLVNLFWIFDQSGAFDILQDSDTNISGMEDIESPNRSRLDLLQRKLLEIPDEDKSINDIQTADICVTRQWMRAVLWRFSVNHGLLPSISADEVTSLSYPFQIAREFLSVISHIPNSAIEAHGQGIELKIYEIASSVTDAIAKNALVGRNSWGSSFTGNGPGDILNRLHQILCLCRGGNKRLVSMLCDKIAQVRNGQMVLIEPSNRIVEEEGSPEQWHIRDSNNLNGHMNLDMDGNLESTDNPIGFDYHDIYERDICTRESGRYGDQDDPHQQPLISGRNRRHSEIPRTLSPLLPQQPSFLSYSSWDGLDTTNIIYSSMEQYDTTQEADLYYDSEQNLHGVLDNENTDDTNEIEHIGSNNALWFMSGTGAVLQWN